MKKYNLISLTFGLLTIVFCTFYLTSCEEEVLLQETETVNATLLDRALKENPSEEEVHKITEEYQNLNTQEVKEFFDSYHEKMIESIDSRELENLREEFELSKKMRSEILDEALQKFGKSFNQLTEDETTLLLDSKDYSISRASCSSANYNYRACRTTSYDTNCSGYSYYSTPSDPNDCDIEFRFSGYQTKVHGTSWFAKQLINHWGSCQILRRYSGGYTRLLFGQNGVYFWIGSVSLAQTRLKMK